MSVKTKLASLAAIPLIVVLAGCGTNTKTAASDEATPAQDETTTNAGAAGTPVATAHLKLADGTDAGTATVTSQAGTLMLTLHAMGLPPGEHGTHVHATGKCDPPDFKSAGGHWNPAGKEHGLENPKGQHAGDMPNLVVGADGTGTLEYGLKGGTGEELLDDDGSAIVIHAGADDQTTDPSGDSGDRIACGVFVAD